MDDVTRDAIDGWDLDQLSRFLGDVELRYGERLITEEHEIGWSAELCAVNLSATGEPDLEAAMRKLANQAAERDYRNRPGS